MLRVPDVRERKLNAGGISQFIFEQRSLLRGEGDSAKAKGPAGSGGGGTGEVSPVENASQNQQIEHYASILRRTRAQRNYRPQAAEADEEVEDEGIAMPQEDSGAAGSIPPAKMARSRSPSESSSSPTSPGTGSHAAAAIHQTAASESVTGQKVSDDRSEHELPGSSSATRPVGAADVVSEGEAAREARAKPPANARGDDKSDAEAAAERERQWLALFARQHTDAELLAARERYFERLHRRDLLIS